MVRLTFGKYVSSKLVPFESNDFAQKILVHRFHSLYDTHGKTDHYQGTIGKRERDEAASRMELASTCVGWSHASVGYAEEEYS